MARTIDEQLQTKILQIRTAEQADTVNPELVGASLELLRRQTKEVGNTSAKIVTVTGKNRFNKAADKSVVSVSETSSTGYIITDSKGHVSEFTSASSSSPSTSDNYPDENILGAYFHQYFGWIYDAALFTSHKISLDADAVTATFFNGGIPKTILAFDASGNYLGYVVTDSSDWAHVTMLASSFPTADYIRLSSCAISSDMNAIQLENGSSPTAYEAYTSTRAISKTDLPNDVVYSSWRGWTGVINSIETLTNTKAPLEIIAGKNKFNKSAPQSHVTESEGSSTGYIITDSSGNVEEFVSHSASDTTDVDGLPDENIYGAYFHQYFGWIFDEGRFTSHKIPFSSGAVTATFFNGGISKTILAFDASGNYLGYVETSSSDWAHVTMHASMFSGVAYVRLSNCTISADPSVVQLEAGTGPTAYEPYKSGAAVPKSSLPSDTIYESNLAARSENKGAATTLKSGMIDIVAGHYDQYGRPVTGSGNQYISDYVPIYGGLVYEFEYINAIHFYDANRSELTGTTIDAGFAYQAPDNAKFMSVSFNGTGRISYSSVYASEYTSAQRSSDLNLLPSNAPDVNQISGSRLHKSTYIIGDSEAANFHHYVDAVQMSRIVSSFGGHTSDLIAANVGQGTGGIGSLSHLKGANVIVVAGTNDQASGQDARLIAYHRELIHRLRSLGANEIFAISPFWDITQDPLEMRTSPFVANMKRLYGGHYIDVMQHVLDCGVYYNPYHPAAFTQPSVGGSVTLEFEDVDALTECGMIAVGDKFWIRYYDDKADLYQCTAYSTTNNTVSAKLVTNDSDVAPGDTGGIYTESVSTPAWSGGKTTIGWVYNEEDGQRISNGQIPACIYADRSVHFGKIIARIIEDMLSLYYGVL